jgi:hypothetical protein
MSIPSRAGGAAPFGGKPIGFGECGPIRLEPYTVGRVDVTGRDDFPRNVRSSMPQLQNDLKKSALTIRIRPNVLMIPQLSMIRDVIPAKARGHMTLMRTIA